MKPSQEKLVILVAAMSQLSMQFVANMATILIPEISMELNISTELQLWQQYWLPELNVLT